jgi:hypothetical protein
VRPEIAVHWCAEGGLPAVSGSSSGIGIPTCPANVNADVDDGTEMPRPRLAFLRLDEARLIP